MLYTLDVSHHAHKSEDRIETTADIEAPSHRDRPIWEMITGGDSLQSYWAPIITGEVSWQVRSKTEEPVKVNYATVYDQRVELISRELSGKLSKEEFRRLEMLENRLKKIHPTVSESEYAQMETIVDKLEHAKKVNDDLRRKLQLD